MKKSEFTPEEIATLQAAAKDLEFNVIYAPTFAGEATPPLPTDWVDGMETADYPRLIRAADRHAFYAAYKEDVRPTTDDRPFFFHTTKLEDQFQVAFGKTMLFGNGLSALMTLMGISAGAGRAVRARPAPARRRHARARLVPLAGLLRRARRRLHADRGVGAAALRAAARPSGVLADGHAVLAAARHRPRRGVEPPAARRNARALDGDHARRDRRARLRRHRRS